jgi:hypothetical protein
MMTFLEYGDYESLRETCIRLHNHTGRVRRRFSLLPMGGVQRHVIAACQFLKWATASDLAQEKAAAKSPPKFAGSPSKFVKPNLMKHISLLDKTGRECCYRKWIEVADDSSMFEFSSKRISREGCANLVCQLSHDTPVVEYYAIEKLAGLIDLRCTLLSCSRMFGDNFLWKKEPYIIHLFNALADITEVTRLRVSGNSNDSTSDHCNLI